jgi:hypothetical protein
MSFHTCWILEAPPDAPGVPVSDLLDRLAVAFPVHEFDADGARAEAAKRLAALTAVGAPEPILAGYRDARPVRVVLADGPGARHVLDFTVWPDAAGSVSGIQVSFATAAHQDACYPALVRVAEVTGWELEEDTESS